jgi:alkanesulfonate monooxygenase SsuD/methylene tetrahydromethanopterin reductase-like flavin-dependent oxidoreductase (luciferase family)
MAAAVDAISEERLILGLGAGWHQPEFDAFGVPFDHTVSRFDEALQIIVPLLREGKVDFNGQFYRAPQCELQPPPRAGGPPILIGSFKPRTMGLTARHADLWNTCWLGQPTLLGERRVALDAACAAEGRDPATLQTTVGLIVGAPGHDLRDLDPAKVLVGSTDEIAAGLRAHQQAGVAHAICSLTPGTISALDWLAEAVAAFRAS